MLEFCFDERTRKVSFNNSTQKYRTIVENVQNKNNAWDKNSLFLISV